MTNAQASEAPFFGPGAQSFPSTDVPGRPRTGHGRRTLVVGMAAVCFAAATIGGVQYARVSSQAPAVTHAAKLAAAIGAAQAYQQSGSVFTEQVPQGAVAADQSALSVGGSVYTEQVPSAATANLAYGSDGSVYTGQVPSAR